MPRVLRYSRSRMLKTIGYRITASIIAQLTSWLLFRRVEVNLGVLAADLIQMGWYYCYEGLMDKVNKK